VALVAKVEAACEKVYLRALQGARPRDRRGETVDAPAFRVLKVKMLEEGLRYAPKSTPLKRHVSLLKQQISVDKRRAAERQAKADRQKQLAQERAANRQAREMLSGVHGSGWKCGEFAFRLLPGGRAKFMTRDWSGGLHWSSNGSYRTEVHGPELELQLLERGRSTMSLFIKRVTSRQIYFATGPGSRIYTWCNATSRI
jgi:hypothetical protein